MTQCELVDAIGIIDRRIFEVRQVISNDGFLLSFADLLGVRAYAVRGSDQKPMVDHPCGSNSLRNLSMSAFVISCSGE